MRNIAILALLALAACGPKVITQDRPVTVKVPVAQACAGSRPMAPTPLKDTTPDWAGLDVKQKAALVGKQALEWQGYGESLNAATAACP
jgi:hypothetical protein